MIAIGQNLTLIDTQYSREPNGLTTLTYFYEGTPAAVDLTILTLPSDYGFRKSVSDAPKVSLQVIIPNPSDTAQNEEMAFHWEVLGNDDQKSLLEHETVIAWNPKLLDALRTAIANEDNKTYDQRIDDLETAVANYSSPGNATLGKVVGFFNLILNDQNYLVPQYVLRLNQTIGSRYSKQISDPNVRKIYTTAQVIAEASTNLTPLPQRIKYKIENIQPLPTSGRIIGQDYSGEDSYTWGWLKKSSTETQIAGGKIEIQTEWVLDLWSELIYSLVA
jgi:hypothetical protein